MGPQFRSLQRRLVSLRRASQETLAEDIRSRGDAYKASFSKYEELARELVLLLDRVIREIQVARTKDPAAQEKLKNSLAALKLLRSNAKGALQQIDAVQNRLDSALTDVSNAMFATGRTFAGLPDMLGFMEGLPAPKSETAQEFLDVYKKMEGTP